MSNLLLDVRVVGGAPVRQAIAEMCYLANKIGMTVVAECNGTRVVAAPRSDDYALYLRWELDRDGATPTVREAP